MKKANNCKRYLYLSTLLFLAVVTFSCGRLSQRTANERFLKEHPTYTIVFSETGEGWEGVGYHHFAFKKPNDENDGTWKVTGRWTPKE